MPVGENTTLADVVAAIHAQGNVLRDILDQVVRTNGRVSKLEDAEASRERTNAIKAQLLAEGWAEPGHVAAVRDEVGVVTWKQLWMAGGAIGVLLTGIATAVAKFVGL